MSITVVIWGNQPLECDEIRWVTLDEINQFPFPKANEKIIAALRNNP